MCMHRTTASESYGVKHIPVIQELLIFLRGQQSERKGICRQRGREAHSSSQLADFFTPAATRRFTWVRRERSEGSCGFSLLGDAPGAPVRLAELRHGAACAAARVVLFTDKTLGIDPPGPLT